jgi:hypothetical protein
MSLKPETLKAKALADAYAREWVYGSRLYFSEQLKTWALIQPDGHGERLEEGVGTILFVLAGMNGEKLRFSGEKA